MLIATLPTYWYLHAVQNAKGQRTQTDTYDLKRTDERTGLLHYLYIYISTKEFEFPLIS